MPFSPHLKKEVREKAGFQCCRCHKFQVEVHHIIPEKDGGLDTIDNAAPLCPNCHDELGDNPVKRKQVRQNRDWWYKVIENKYGRLPGDATHLQEISQTLKTIKERTESLIELKEQLKQYSTSYIDKITLDTAEAGASAIVNASLPSTGYGASYYFSPAKPDNEED